MKLTIRKTLLLSLAVLGILALAALAVSFFRVNRTINIPGLFQYRTSVPVVIQESGFVESVLADTDTAITTRQPIMKLENDTLDAEIEVLGNQIAAYHIELSLIESQRSAEIFQTNGTISGLEKSLSLAKDRETFQEQTVKRNQSLYEAGRISQSQFQEISLQYQAAVLARESTESRIETAKSGLAAVESTFVVQKKLKRMAIDAAEDKLDRLEDRLKNLTVRAPTDGLLLAEDLDQLQHTYISKGSTVARVVSGDDINFLGYATGPDVIRVSEGQKVYFDVDVFRRKVFVQGTVSKVGFEAVMQPSGVRLFPVTIEVDNKAFLDRGNTLYIQSGVPGEAVVVVEESLSLITMVWERILDFVDFEVYLK